MTQGEVKVRMRGSNRFAPFARFSLNYTASLSSQVTSAKINNAYRSPARHIASHERIRSRKSVCSTELSRCASNRLARLFADHHLADSALARIRGVAFRNRFSPRHGP